MERKKKLAIACQGGGSHTAFTAGVLQKLLAEGVQEKYYIVGLSGTSGGGICAATAGQVKPIEIRWIEMSLEVSKRLDA